MDRGLYPAFSGTRPTRPAWLGFYSLPHAFAVPHNVGRLPPRMPSPTPGCLTATPFASIRLDLGLAALSSKW